jgi:excisionase family DNA binding protein
VKTEQRFEMLLQASPDQLTAIDQVLAGEQDQQRPNLRLYRIADAARETGCSRSTIQRAIADGRLRVVTIREGSRRIPYSSLLKFAGVKK